jgi:hypothetical protein
MRRTGFRRSSDRGCRRFIVVFQSCLAWHRSLDRPASVRQLLGVEDGTRWDTKRIFIFGGE